MTDWAHLHSRPREWPIFAVEWRLTPPRFLPGAKVWGEVWTETAPQISKCAKIFWKNARFSRICYFCQLIRIQGQKLSGFDTKKSIFISKKSKVKLLLCRRQTKEKPDHQTLLYSWSEKLLCISMQDQVELQSQSSQSHEATFENSTIGQILLSFCSAFVQLLFIFFEN